MNRDRGDVVVRVRAIEEEIATVEAARAAALANASRTSAQLADDRARRHPLHGRGSGLHPGELMAAVGMAGALREAALAARRRAELAEESLAAARLAANGATARRKAAERLVERRVAAVEDARQRVAQRALDESATNRRTG